MLAQWGLGVCSAPKPQEKQFSCLLRTGLLRPATLDFHPEVRGIVNEEGTSPPRPSAAPSLSTNQAYELVACQIPHLPDACLELCRGSTSPKIASKPTVYITLRVSLLLLTISSWCLASKQPSPIHSWPPESHLLTRLQGRNDRHSRTLLP